MTGGQRVLFSVAAALLAVVGTLLLLGGWPQPVQADPGTLCVAPGGSGCNPGVCGGTCYPSVQEAVDAASTDDDILVATGTYTGIQARGGMTQVVYISKTVTLRGGYSSDLTTWDPEAYPTTLDAQRQGRVVSIVPASDGSTLEGFTITGGDATGVTANCPAAGGPSDGCGGGIFVRSVGPIIVNNVITNNVAAVSGSGRSASGGGICVAYGTGAVISGNLIISNVASLGERGMGGGMDLNYPNNVLVLSNRVLSNTATTHASLAGWGGGISTGGSTGTIEDNRIEGNRTNGGSTGAGAGIYQWQSAISFADNQVVGNYGSQAVYLGYSQSPFEANQVVSNSTSIGIELLYGSGGGATLVNNVVARSGDRSFSARGHVNFPLKATLIHNTLAGSGTGYGVYVETGYVTLFLTNTIVVSHTWGITNTVPTSSTVFADHTLFWGNDYDGITGTNPVNGNPAFVDPNDGDYHIGPGSAAINGGVEAGVTADVDGEMRPEYCFPDIGADEFMTGLECQHVYLPLVLRNY